MKKVLLALLCMIIFYPALYCQNIATRGEIYDYDIGDMFHERYYEEIDGYWWEKIYSRTIIDKYYSADNDTVFYTTDIIQMERETYPPGWEWSNYQHTGHVTDLDLLINDGNIDTVYTDETLYNGREINFLEIDNPPNTNNKYRYVKGCGRAYRSYHGYGFGWSVTELLYYQKGDEEWGEPITILSQDEKTHESDLLIYPNPVNSRLHFVFAGNSEKLVSIYSVNGMKVFSEKAVSTQDFVDLPKLEPGIYFLLVGDSERMIKRTFVKK